jgi:hypothetical protein
MKRALLLAAVAALAGCGGNGASPMTTPMPTGTGGSPQNAAVKADPRTETKLVTKEAATLKFAALKAELIVPKDAVTDPTKVTGQIPVEIKEMYGLVPDTLMQFNAAKFAKPVELMVKKPKKKGDLYLAERKDGKWVDTKAAFDEKKGLYRLSTNTLGTYAVGIRPAKKKGEKSELLGNLPKSAKVKIPKLGF